MHRLSMVVPLIVGAARVTKSKRALKKTNKINSSGSAIAYRRKQKLGNRTVTHSHSSRHKSEPEEQREDNARRMQNILPYRKALQKIGGGTSKSKVKKMKALRRGAMTLSSVLYPMLMQLAFAIVVLTALSVEDSWWGWVDVVDASLTVASIFWILALILGTYTMFIAAFRMSMYFRHWKVVIAFIFCFSANWAPVLQLVPWVGIWIFYIVINEK